MITLITGGSGSGKSAYGEDLVTAGCEEQRIYIATMCPYDDESFRRIDRHRKMREGKGFCTVEQYVDIKSLVVPPGSAVLLECMSNLVANEMFQEGGAGVNTVEEILQGIQALEKQASRLYIITNEISSDGLSYEEETKRYQRYLGEINREIGIRANQVVEVVYGIPIIKKNDKEIKTI